MSGRTVEVGLDLAKRIADALTVVPGLDGELAALDAAIDRAEAIPDVLERLRLGETIPLDSVIAEFDAEAAMAELAPTGHRPRPQWSNVAKATRIIGRNVADSAHQARADELGAYVRDTWDALGLSLYDEETLYVALTTAGLLVEMAHNGHTRNPELVDADVVIAVAQIAQSFTAAVLPYLPKEAQP